MMRFRSFDHFSAGSRSLLFALLIPTFLLAACEPYQPPTFLQNTAGAPITLYDQTYTGETFSVSYPESWRVITPPAESTESVVLAGENCQIVHISTIPIQPSSPAECPSDQMRFEPLEREGIYIYGAALAESWDAFEPVLSQIASSLTIHG